MRSDREVFEHLLRSIENNARDNEATITHVDLWAKSWREELYRERVYSNDMEVGVRSKPPLGLIPKKYHDERVKVERLNEVCGAIARYYDAGLKIKIKWIKEYNRLVECGSKDYA